jgi:hypothetical protein
MKLKLKHVFMMLVLLVMTVLVIIIRDSQVNKETVNPGIYGSWDLVELKNAGMIAQITLTFEKNKVISKNSCSYKNYAINVQATSPVKIIGDKIQILKSSHNMKEYKPGFLQCKANVDEGVVYYQILNGNLLLKKPDESEVLELSRSGQVFKQSRQYKSHKEANSGWL